MKRVVQAVVVAAALLSVVSVVRTRAEDPAEGPPPPPPPREIPGITAEDPHPHACVDCHVNMKEFNKDVRISTLMGQWQQGAEPKLLAAAKATAPDPEKITGKHPKVSTSGEIPKSCLMCHGAASKTAPPFSQLMHVVHLTGGEENLYLGYYQGDCTHCHKLDMKTGAWSIPSAKEPAEE